MYVEAIKSRTSVRTYSDRQVEEEALGKVEEILKDTQNPFGAKVRFGLLEAGKEKARLGTYGFIKGQKYYIAGCLEKGEKDLEGYGYAFEKLILKLTDLGLGTCWLGGTFNRGGFKRSVSLSETEILPAVTPIGYPSDKRSLVERTVALNSGGRARKRFEELFFDEDFTTPLETDDYKLSTCLEMVRIGPSASNKQPWRAVRKDGSVHFYLARTKGYSGNAAFGFTMQKIDMGIAACHFNLTAKELGVNGSIAIDDPGIISKFEYSFSWKEA